MLSRRCPRGFLPPCSLRGHTGLHIAPRLTLALESGKQVGLLEGSHGSGFFEEQERSQFPAPLGTDEVGAVLVFLRGLAMAMGGSLSLIHPELAEFLWFAARTVRK